MKKTLLVIATVLFAACAAIPDYVFIVDYRPYLAEGFRIYSSDAVPFEYDCLADISIDKYWVRQDSASGTYAVNGERIPSDNDYITHDEVLAEFVDRAKAMGANGIIGLRIRFDRRTGYYNITGTAVKITPRTLH
mgnify:FL=1